MAVNNIFLNSITDRWCALNKALHTKLIKGGIVDRLGNPVPGWEARVEADKSGSAGKSDMTPEGDYGSEAKPKRPLVGAAKASQEAKAARLAAAAAAAEAEEEAKPKSRKKAPAKPAKPVKPVKSAKKVASADDDLLDKYIAKIKSESASAKPTLGRGRPGKFEPEPEDLEEDDAAELEEELEEVEDSDADEGDEFPSTDEDEEEPRTVIVK